MKSLLLISLALILLLLTAGCLDDLSSTLPPCCDGTCNMTKTSVITVSQTYYPFDSVWLNYAVDSDGLMYVAEISKTYANHNVTFSYEMVNGHRHITGIIEDHEAKKCGCEVHIASDNTRCINKPDGSTSCSGWVMAQSGNCCQCVQKCCGCE